MKACGFIGQVGLSMSAQSEKVLEKDLHKISEEFDVVFVGFYGVMQNFVAKFLRKNLKHKVKIVGVQGFDRDYSDLEREYLSNLYDDVIKIGERDVFQHINSVILKNSTKVCFFVDETRSSDEISALSEAKKRDLCYKNYFLFE